MKTKPENLDDIFDVKLEELEECTELEELEECTEVVVVPETETEPETTETPVVGFSEFLTDFNTIKNSLISDVTSYDVKITQLLQEDDIEGASLLIDAKQKAAKAVLSGYDDLVRLSLVLNTEQQTSLSDILKDDKQKDKDDI